MTQNLGEDWTSLDRRDRSGTIKKLLKEEYGPTPRRSDIEDMASARLKNIYGRMDEGDQKALINDLRSSALHGDWDWQGIRRSLIGSLGDRYSKPRTDAIEHGPGVRAGRSGMALH